MKKLLIIFLFIFTIFGSACPSYAEDLNKLYALGPPTMMMIVAGGSSWSCAYQLCETADSTGYDNATCGTAPCVTETTGTPNEDTAIGGLDSGIDMDGTYCIDLDYGETLDFTHTELPSGWNQYYMFHWAFNDTMEVDRSIFIIYDTEVTPNIVAYVQVKTDGALKVCVTGGSGCGTSATGIVSVDSDIWLQVRYKRGTSNDSFITIKYWTGSAWSSSTNSTFNGTNTNAVDTVRFINAQDESAEHQYVDSVFTDTSEFTNAPSTYLP